MKIKAFCLFAMLSISAGNTSFAAGCAVTDGLLNCGDGDGEAKAVALTAPETMKLFSDPTPFKPIFNGNKYARELFRVSLEDVRRDIEQYARQFRRDEKRGRIDRAEYNRRNELYLKAIAAYGEGYWFYKNLRWQSN